MGLTCGSTGGADWFVRDRKGPHVDREAWTVKFDPTGRRTMPRSPTKLAKIVG